MASNQHIRWLIVAVLWTSILLYFSLIPQPPHIVGPLGWDKFQHAFSLGIMCFLVSVTCLKFRKSLTKASLIGFISAVVCGGLIEIFQKLFTMNRQADIHDFVADVAGAFLAAISLALVVNYRGRR